MHPEGVPVFPATQRGVRPLQGRALGRRAVSPGALRRADECDPFRVEDGEEADANQASEGSSTRGGSRTFNATFCERRDKNERST